MTEVTNLPTVAETTGVKISERKAVAIGGGGVGLIFIATAIAWIGAILLLINGIKDGQGVLIISALALVIVAIALSTTYKIISPGEALVLSFFGNYMGTVRKSGLVAILPFMNVYRMSIKDLNFETPVLKVNDYDGNPINISSIVVWRLKDTAKAVYAVENFNRYLKTQAESAVRHVAGLFPYDAEQMTEEETKATLLNNTEAVNAKLFEEIQERSLASGVEIVEVRINSLSYSVEIAQAMLQRQQASAIVAARKTIVQGAVGIVEETVEKLEKDTPMTASEKNRLTSNLLLVLVSENKVSPVIDLAS